MELDDATYDRIRALCAEGDQLADDDRFDEALVQYGRALDLVPKPVETWHAATWIHAAIADAQFFQGRHIEARASLQRALRCPGGVSNPFLHLRMGQVALELGHERQAVNELTLAYAVEGRDIFADEDPKYWAFLSSKIKT